MVPVECDTIRSPASFSRCLKTASDLRLEGGVADGGDLVDQVPVEGDAHRHAEGEPRPHARGIGAHRHVEEVAELGEVLHVGDERVGVDAVDARHEAHVLRAGEIAGEAAAEAERPGDRGVPADRAGSGRTVPAIMPRSVDLPAPLRPSTPTLAPAGRVRVKSSSTTLRPWVGEVVLADVAELDHRARRAPTVSSVEIQGVLGSSGADQDRSSGMRQSSALVA